MKGWDEASIALVYYSGLSIALALGVLTVVYLKAVAPLTRIIGAPSTLWRHSFRSTLITAGLVGALSVSFRSCDCSYTCLLESPVTTINLGIQQVRQAFITLGAVATGWLLILIIAQLVRFRFKSIFVCFLLLGTITIPLAIMWFCLTFELF